ncbi:PEGA domain-containing protein [Christiangramia forsetii]|uniref:PEGA domain-containing protein n=2 Tax=Christiangramia forsetii TaxID=411153 RepID=A0M5W8_CHRFK|nr:PEGA domain-containing protein [Christiangramia forsetii]GGG32016.1 hypothetical protein GCM10011532_14370 [Christiangramia forsetii]CAL68013.1 conserved hypothetical protein, secreted [Christiangramia forsetii KT0803]
MKNLFKILPLAAFLVLQSCATIVSGSKQTVKFNSEPKAATVYINEIPIGKTPVEKKLKRNQKYQVLIKMEGYQTYETTLSKKFNEWYIGNVIFGGLIGLVVDPITGAMYKLTPNELSSNLIPSTAVNLNDTDIHISVSMNIDPEWEQVGQLVKAE